MRPARDIHATVLSSEVVEWLGPRPGGRYVDATLGLGGHAEALLSAGAEDIQVLGLDRDRRALEKAGERLAVFGDRVHLAHLPFSKVDQALDELGWDLVDGAVADLGVSSMQLDTAERGFSFLGDGPLDMRMDPEGGAAPAEALVNRGSFEELRRIIREYGDEPLAGKIARAVVRRREEAPLQTTGELAELVVQAYPPKMRYTARNHPATRTFMALRMAVNQELEELRSFLEHMPPRIKNGGRLAVISFHSMEDRLVKHTFRELSRECVCPQSQMLCTCRGRALAKVLTKKPQRPSEEEQAVNPRSRSAKLRVMESLFQEVSA